MAHVEVAATVSAVFVTVMLATAMLEIAVGIFTVSRTPVFTTLVAQTPPTLTVVVDAPAAP